MSRTKLAETGLEYSNALMRLGQKMLDTHCRGWKFDIENLNNGYYRSVDRPELEGHGLTIGGTNFATRARPCRKKSEATWETLVPNRGVNWSQRPKLD
jgi:hypothetical protein